MGPPILIQSATTDTRDLAYVRKRNVMAYRLRTRLDYSSMVQLETINAEEQKKRLGLESDVPYGIQRLL